MSEVIRANVVPILYLLSAVLFVVGIKQLARVRTSRRGNALAAAAMGLAIVGTLLDLGLVDYRWILAGTVVGSGLGALAALRVPMTAMPEMVALFNGFGGLASLLVALSAYWIRAIETQSIGTAASLLGGPQAVTVVLSIGLGGITFSGSFVAFLKLQGRINGGRPVLIPARHVINIAGVAAIFGSGGWFAYGVDQPSTGALYVLGLAVASLVIGVLLVLPIGGADMPVVVSLLNSYSGIAAAFTGFVLGNQLLIISGALVGASGLILTHIMSVAMNRSLVNVVAGGFGEVAQLSAVDQEYNNVRACGPEEAAMVLETAESVVLVPGYGLAVAQAQHATREFAAQLEKRGVKVRYAIHPVAGRMPGHMNVLLAEADVPYENLVEMDLINPELRNTDVVIVLGANDVVNPVALTDKSSPIYGMPILLAHEARSVFVVKRSLAPGYAGIKNTLFERQNTMMIFGDAKKVLQELTNELKAG